MLDCGLVFLRGEVTLVVCQESDCEEDLRKLCYDESMGWFGN